LWIAVAAGNGLYLMRHAAWTTHQVIELCAIAGFHAFAVNLVRSVWYQAILARLRRRLFTTVPPIQMFGDGYFAALVHVSMGVSGGTAAAIAAFTYFFLPISLEQSLDLGLVVPAALLFALVGMTLHSHYQRRIIDQYLRGTTRAGWAPAAGRARDR